MRLLMPSALLVLAGSDSNSQFLSQTFYKSNRVICPEYGSADRKYSRSCSDHLGGSIKAYTPIYLYIYYSIMPSGLSLIILYHLL